MLFLVKLFIEHNPKIIELCHSLCPCLGSAVKSLITFAIVALFVPKSRPSVMLWFMLWFMLDSFEVFFKIFSDDVDIGPSIIVLCVIGIQT